ncbi:MAG TPA: hypothetical protein VHN99_08625, partial [Deinococcales bacterium]|nr:hypothetical protein [Deinococcales bacterium]
MTPIVLPAFVRSLPASPSPGPPPEGAERAAPAAGPPEDRSVDFVVSNARRDRCRTVLNPSGWNLESYALNPVVGYGHAPLRAPTHPDEILGRGRVWLEGDALIGRVTFDPPDVNPLAEKVFRKVLLGSLNAASVAF